MTTYTQTGYDKLAVWHGQKDAYIKNRPDYIPTTAAHVAEWRRGGNSGFPPNYRAYKESRENWLASAIAEFKTTNPAPLDGAGNMTTLF